MGATKAVELCRCFLVLTVRCAVGLVFEMLALVVRPSVGLSVGSGRVGAIKTEEVCVDLHLFLVWTVRCAVGEVL